MKMRDRMARGCPTWPVAMMRTAFDKSRRRVENEFSVVVCLSADAVRRDTLETDMTLTGLIFLLAAAAPDGTPYLTCDVGALGQEEQAGFRDVEAFGSYRRTFEASTFRPDDIDEVWWVWSQDLNRLADSLGTNSLLVRLRGRLSPRGRYGLRNQYRRCLAAIEIVDVITRPERAQYFRCNVDGLGKEEQAGFKEVETTGIYTQSFEVSEFSPDDSDDVWWVWSKELGDVVHTLGGNSVHVRVRGRLSRKARWGHGLGYQRCLVEVEIVEVLVRDDNELE